MPEALGRRVRQIRKSLGLSQKGVPGVNQPRLSKIEAGKEEASADVIDKLAAAFGRDGLTLVRGTDREGHYTAQRLQPDQRDELVRLDRLKDAVTLEILYLQYSRIFELFNVLYGEHTFVVHSASWLEERYIDLRERCKSCMHRLTHIIPDIFSIIYFPDHIEPEGDMDDLVIGSWEFEGADVKKSLHNLQEAMHEYRDCYSEEARAAIEKHLNFKVIDEEIEALRAAQKKAHSEFVKRMNRIASDPKHNPFAARSTEPKKAQEQ